MAKTDQQKLALKLADTYLHAQRPAKAESIYRRFLGSSPSLAPHHAQLEGYCLFRLGLAYSRQHIKTEKSIEYYKRFYKEPYASLPWAADAIMCLGVLEHNRTQDPKRSMPHYRHIVANYPNHREAERASYFLALNAVQLGNRARAEKYCRKYLHRYPNGDRGWRAHIQRVLEEEVPKLETRERGEK